MKPGTHTLQQFRQSIPRPAVRARRAASVSGSSRRVGAVADRGVCPGVLLLTYLLAETGPRLDTHRYRFVSKLSN